MKTMSDPSPAVVTRVRIESDYTAMLIVSIWLLGWVLTHLLDGLNTWWLVAVPAIAGLCALFSIRVCRAHSFRVAAFGAAQAREQ